MHKLHEPCTSCLGKPAQSRCTLRPRSAAKQQGLSASLLRRNSINMSNSSLFWHLLIVSSMLLLQLHCSLAWMPDVRPDLLPKQDKIIARFYGNRSDYFKILDHDDGSILVGARDVIYNISLNGLRENSRLEWISSDADRELCALKGKNESDCHNYIRVFARLDKGKLLVCGTNSYKPRCRHYAPVKPEDASDETASSSSSASTFAYEIVRDVEAQGLCPYSPIHNSTYAFADGQLYSATVADFSGSDPLIYRENLRTEQYDLKQLNQPDFVGAIEHKGYVLFFFREISMEYMNFGKAIYSRVGRVCKNDRGGPYTLSKSWTTFLKARLNCSMPGEFPFYFDEIQSISPVVQSSGSVSLVYAVFTTSVNAIPGSAICAFNIDDIMDAFEGRFKSQKDIHSQWLPIQEEQVPEPRPGKCVDDSRMLSSIAVNFAKNHPLMESAVPPLHDRPLLTKVNLHHRLTTIAVHAQVQSLQGDYYDVIYTGTDDGKVTKFINIPSAAAAASSSKLRTVVISEMQVLPLGTPIRELVVSAKTNTLLVVNDGSLVTVPLHHCTHIVDCLGCLSLQDPNCAWDTHNHECKSLSANNNKFGTKFFLQSLNSTKKAAAALCPKSAHRNAAAAPSINNDVSNTLPPLDGSQQQSAAGIAIVQIAQLPSGDDAQLLAKKHHYANVEGATVLSNTAAVASSAVVAVGQGTEMDLQETAIGAEFLEKSFSDSKHVTAVDLNDLNGAADPQQSTMDEQKLLMAGNSIYWGFGTVALACVFIIGMGVGLFTSNRFCKSSAMHANHRNQFINSTSQFHVKYPNSNKDVNLLMNPNIYSTTSHNHQKKPNLDLEKDRSHECKNSTENLEKELPMKTSTLTKVKRTYI